VGATFVETVKRVSGVDFKVEFAARALAHEIDAVRGSCFQSLSCFLIAQMMA
jgi:hypothetical protein